MVSNEIQRLRAVGKFMELEDHIVADLNEIAGLAAQICNTPVSLVTLLDQDKLWFKAAIGTDLNCADRELAFCNYTIRQPDVMLIPDLSKDERFSDNPLVTGAFNARFYAGAPLITKDGFALGTLCVLNVIPANLNEHQVNSLKVLAKQVVNLMELNWSLKSLEQQHKQTQIQKLAIGKSEMKLKAIFDSSKDTHILVGSQMEVLAFNKSAAVFVRTTFNKKLNSGDNILQYTSPELLKQFSKYFAVALSGRSIKREWALMPGTLNESWKETSFIPVKDAAGNVIGVALNATDITTRKRHEEQIRIQNEALQRIAIIQSHELRRPVASLLGIMDLIRIEKIEFSYFDIMELTVQELDEKIRGIVKDSEDTIQGRRLAIVA